MLELQEGTAHLGRSDGPGQVGWTAKDSQKESLSLTETSELARREEATQQAETEGKGMVAKETGWLLHPDPD